MLPVQTVAVDKHYLAKTILAGLPVITDRLKMKEEGTFPSHEKLPLPTHIPMDHSGSGRQRRVSSLFAVLYSM